MKTFKVMMQDNLTGEFTISKKAYSLENAQKEMYAMIGRMLCEEGFDRSGAYSENGKTLSISVEKLGPVGCGQIHSRMVTLLLAKRGTR